MAEINLRDLIEGNEEKGIKGFLENEDLFKKDITNIDDGDIYNEFSLQHELGIFLRKKFEKEGFKIQFEKNIEYFGGNGFVKSEMDIVVFNGIDQKSEKYAIELKFPTNGAVPKRMYQFVEDIKFMEEVKFRAGFNKTYCLTLVSDLAKGDGKAKGDGFWKEKNKNDGIYQYFRGGSPTPILGKVINPIKVKDDKKSRIPPFLEITKKHQIKWSQIKDTSFHYYLLEI